MLVISLQFVQFRRLLLTVQRQHALESTELEHGTNLDAHDDCFYSYHYNTDISIATVIQASNT